MTAWLGEGLGRGEFTAMHKYDERVRWGTEARPDRELWGGDDKQLRALASWEASLEPAPNVQVMIPLPLDDEPTA